MNKAPLLIAMGTRPEFVKLSPLIVELTRRDVPMHIVLTGQHWDEKMCGDFLADIEPDEVWELPAGSAERMAEMTSRAAKTIASVRPRATVVLGDTHTVPVFALASRRENVAVIHIEAGLRSLNPQSIEEVNRRVASAVASMHFAPTETAAAFLRSEGVEMSRIHVVGNTAIDALSTSGIDRIPADDRTGALVTAHRPTNVDGEALTDLVASVIAIHRNIEAVTFPVHPRTRSRLLETGLWAELERAGVKLLDPVDHDAMLTILSRSKIVVTDSGGLQEEAAYFGVPAVVLRRSTPRWEGIDAGVATLCRIEPSEVLDAARRLLSTAVSSHDLYGAGNTAVLIADVLSRPTTEGLLSLDEPDFTDGSLPEVVALGSAFESGER